MRDFDYNATDPVEVIFEAGVAVQGSAACANIGIIDDEALEGPHSFTVSIMEFNIMGGISSTARISLGTQSLAIVLIGDNDGTYKSNVCVLLLLLCTAAFTIQMPQLP